MQFSIVALLSVASLAVAETVFETDVSSTLVTVTSCASEVTDCPAKTVAPASTSASNYTAPANVSSAYEGAANKQFAVGGVALIAGALLAL